MALALVVLTNASLCLSFGYCLQDDAFISLRYARNLAEGRGLVYNVGERVEGYTNFLWTVYAAGVTALGLDPELWLIVAGIGGAAGMILATWALGRRDQGLGAALVGPILVACNPDMALEAVQGLESTTFAAVLGGATWASLREAEHPERRLPLAAGLLGLAALLRPEGFLAFGLLELVALGHGGRRGFRHRFRSWMAFGAIVGPHLVFRVLYYGDIVPNTFHAKVGASSAQFSRGLDYVGTYLFEHPTLGLFGLLGSGILLWTRRAERRTWTLLTLVGAFLAYIVAVGGDFKHTGRFFLPILPMLAVLAQEGALVVGRASRAPRAMLLVVGMLALLADFRMNYAASKGDAGGRSQDLANGQLMGSWLRANVPADTVLAIHAAGIVPYTSGLPTIDMWGLTDAHIARRDVESLGTGTAGHEKTDYDYVFGRDPDLYIPHTDYVSPQPVQLLIPRDFPLDFEEHWMQYSITVAPGRVLNLYAREDRPLPWQR